MDCGEGTYVGSDYFRNDGYERAGDCEKLKADVADKVQLELRIARSVTDKLKML